VLSSPTQPELRISTACICSLRNRVQCDIDRIRKVSLYLQSVQAPREIVQNVSTCHGVVQVPKPSRLLDRSCRLSTYLPSQHHNRQSQADLAFLLSPSVRKVTWSAICPLHGVDMTTLASVFTLRLDPARLGNGLDLTINSGHPIGRFCRLLEAVTVAAGFETQAAY
jgi:hypothetical protein